MSQAKKVPEYAGEFKLSAVKRVLAGESTREVAIELGVRRQQLYRWKDCYTERGEAGLLHSRIGRPRKAEPLSQPNAEPQAGRGELLAARRRIAELERKVGQQELELDFFGEALRRIDAATKPVDAKRSTR